MIFKPQPVNPPDLLPTLTSSFSLQLVGPGRELGDLPLVLLDALGFLGLANIEGDTLLRPRRITGRG